MAPYLNQEEENLAHHIQGPHRGPSINYVVSKVEISDPFSPCLFYLVGVYLLNPLSDYPTTPYRDDIVYGRPLGVSHLNPVITPLLCHFNYVSTSKVIKGQTKIVPSLTYTKTYIVKRLFKTNRMYNSLGKKM